MKTLMPPASRLSRLAASGARLLFAISLLACSTSPTAPEPVEAAAAGEPDLTAATVLETAMGRASCQVSRIIDGDTFVCGANERVRLIGVNAPEACQAPYGAAATQALSALLPLQTTVTLAFDRERLDRYGRTLAYVLRGATVVNWEMVRQGHATDLAVAPNTSFSWLFAATAQYAWLRDRGMWATWPTSSRPDDLAAVPCL